MWRKICWLFLLALVASMLIIGRAAQMHNIQLSADQLLFSILVLWAALMFWPGILIIIVIVIMHHMKIDIIKIQLMDLLMGGSLNAAQLQDQYKEKWGRLLWLSDITLAMQKAIRSNWIEIGEDQALEINTPLSLTSRGRTTVQECRRNGTAGLRKLI